MKNQTQLERYKNLVKFINSRFKDNIDIGDIEEQSYYSYRNINRIFQALQHETIGHHIKRLRLEKAAEYLKFSELDITEIAYEIGYSDLAAFSKAFKSNFGCSPAVFRDSEKLKAEVLQKAVDPETTAEKISFELEELPELDILYLTYHGSYEDLKSIQETWEKFIANAFRHNLVNDESVFLAEVLDDNEITESIHCRYNCGLILEKPLEFELEGLFQTKTIEKQQYAKFVHKGSHQSCAETYERIYSRWIFDVNRELADKPILEFYLNDERDTPEEELLTEIYIAIQD